MGKDPRRPEYTIGEIRSALDKEGEGVKIKIPKEPRTNPIMAFWDGKGVYLDTDNRVILQARWPRPTKNDSPSWLRTFYDCVVTKGMWFSQPYGKARVEEVLKKAFGIILVDWEGVPQPKGEGQPWLPLSLLESRIASARRTGAAVGAKLMPPPSLWGYRSDPEGVTMAVDEYLRTVDLLIKEANRDMIQAQMKAPAQPPEINEANATPDLYEALTRGDFKILEFGRAVLIEIDGQTLQIAPQVLSNITKRGPAAWAQRRGLPGPRPVRDNPFEWRDFGGQEVGQPKQKKAPPRAPEPDPEPLGPYVCKRKIDWK